MGISLQPETWSQRLSSQRHNKDLNVADIDIDALDLRLPLVFSILTKSISEFPTFTGVRKWPSDPSSAAKG
jgi:hypothetical protein